MSAAEKHAQLEQTKRALFGSSAIANPYAMLARIDLELASLAEIERAAKSTSVVDLAMASMARRRS